MIRVLFANVDYEAVCLYYNFNKPENWEPIKRLDRIEGGFCISRNYKITNPISSKNKRFYFIHMSLFDGFTSRIFSTMYLVTILFSKR